MKINDHLPNGKFKPALVTASEIKDESFFITSCRGMPISPKRVTIQIQSWAEQLLAADHTK